MRFKNTFCIICVMGMMVLTACEGAESIQQNINSTENQPSSVTAQQVEVPTRLTTVATHPPAITPEATVPQEVYVGEPTVAEMQAHGEEFYKDTLARIAAEQGQ